MAAFCIGEFEMTKSDAMNFLMQVAVLPKTTGLTVGYILTAVAKLAVRFGRISDAMIAMEKSSTDNRLEVQQRAGQVGRILSQSQVAADVFAPVDEEAAKAQPAAPPPQQQQTQMRASHSGNRMIWLICSYTAQARPAPQRRPQQPVVETAPPPQAAPAAQIACPPGAVVAFETSDLIAYFEVQVNQADSRQVAIRSDNLSNNALHIGNSGVYEIQPCDNFPNLLHSVYVWSQYVAVNCEFAFCECHFVFTASLQKYQQIGYNFQLT